VRALDDGGPGGRVPDARAKVSRSRSGSAGFGRDQPHVTVEAALAINFAAVSKLGDKRNKSLRLDSCS
jgi:hypothetical protein